MAPASSPPSQPHPHPSVATPTPTPTTSAPTPTPTTSAPVSTTTKPTISATTTATTTAPTSSRLQLPGGVGTKAKGKATASSAGDTSGNPTRATSNEPYEPTTTTSGAHSKPENEGSTNVQDLMDAVGASGVDINAEEDSLRQHRPVASTSSTTNTNPTSHTPSANPPQASLSELDQRIHAQSFIDPQVLADVVRKIAAEYALKSLEGQTIPLIALACRTRLMDVIAKSVEARDHRLGAHHLRKAPFGKGKRRRNEGEGEGEGEEGENNQEDEQEDDAMNGCSGKKKEPVWDSIVYDEPEKALLILEKVDREEERKRRRERVLRDEKEQEEKELREAVEASERAKREEEGETMVEAGIGTGSTPGAHQTTTSTSTTLDSGSMETPKPNLLLKKKKKRELGQSAIAKNLSGDVQKRLTDQIAMRSLGGRSFSWLSGAGGGGGGSAMSTPIRPTGGSTLSTPTLGDGTTPSAGPSTLNPFPSTLHRLTTIPSLHDANRQKIDAEEAWRQGAHVVELKDVLFALDNQRGMGVGKGAGKVASLKARAGVVRKA